MPWDARLKEAAYTSPGGTRMRFFYEAVSSEVDKRTLAFDFPLVDDNYIQDNGHGSRRYPLQCFFWGDDHDLQGEAFEALLLERGVGRLEHPLYGTFDVVPFGSITRRNDLKSEANQTVIEVTFWVTTGLLYPQTESDPAANVLSALDTFDASAATQFASSVDLSTELARANTQARFAEFLSKASVALRTASQATAEVRREFAEAQAAVNASINVLIGQPLALAQQVANLIKFPARAASGIQTRLQGYGDMAQSIFDSAAGQPELAIIPTLGRRRINLLNDFHTADLFAKSAVTGSVLSVVENQFFAKPDALKSAETVLDQFDAVVAWEDSCFATLQTTDTGESYQALQNAVALAAGFLVEISFTLIPERAVVLDRPRTIVDLAPELYKTVADDKLDFLISSNNLSGSEILELPRGKRIKYYAA